MFMNREICEKYRVWAEMHIRPIPLSLDGERPPALGIWGEAAETGLFRLLAPECAGGLGGTLADMAAALYGLALGGMDLPIASSLAAHGAIGLDLLLRFGTDAQKKHYLASIYDGSKVVAICNSEENSGTDIRKLRSEFVENEEGSGRLSTLKGCVTNASIAGICFVSAWRTGANGKRSIEVFLVEGTEVAKEPVNHLLAGFRTGWTGKILVKDLVLERDERQVGAGVGGFRVFRRCFNMERLLMGVMVSAVLEGLERDGARMLTEREGTGQGIAASQYVQEKIVALFAARTKMNAIIQSVLDAGEENVDHFEKELGVLKLLVVEDAFAAASGHFELMGHRSYLGTELPQKILRNMLALRFFGGTKELQKMTIFQALFAASAGSKEKKAA